MKKLMFIYSVEDEKNWKDGLYAAIELLKKDYEVTKYNDADPNRPPIQTDGYDFFLGWGGFGSPVDQVLQGIKWSNKDAKIGLCLGGYAIPQNAQSYDIIFYETEWSKKWLEDRGVEVKKQHAFGINSTIYHERGQTPKIWNYITVGAFASWKRQDKICAKIGPKMAVGQIQKDNLGESIDIIGNLLLGHCSVSDTVSPETLAKMYAASLCCYIPADLMGGGERAVLEARAMGIDVEVEDDNPKLQELLKSKIWDEVDYANSLKKGIEEVLAV